MDNLDMRRLRSRGKICPETAVHTSGEFNERISVTTDERRS
jgi:hypothetical protein